MKYLLMIVVVAWLMVGCGTDAAGEQPQPTPTPNLALVAELYMQSIAAGDVEGAQRYACPAERQATENTISAIQEARLQISNIRCQASTAPNEVLCIYTVTATQLGESVTFESEPQGVRLVNGVVCSASP